MLKDYSGTTLSNPQRLCLKIDAVQKKDKELSQGIFRKASSERLFQTLLCQVWAVLSPHGVELIAKSSFN